MCTLVHDGEGMAKPKHDQLHIRMDPDLHERFYFWCRRHGRTMTEACHLLINAVLDERIDLDEQEKPDDGQSTDNR